MQLWTLRWWLSRYCHGCHDIVKSSNKYDGRVVDANGRQISQVMEIWLFWLSVNALCSWVGDDVTFKN